MPNSSSLGKQLNDVKRSLISQQSNKKEKGVHFHVQCYHIGYIDAKILWARYITLLSCCLPFGYYLIIVDDLVIN